MNCETCENRSAYYAKAIYIAVFGVMGLVMGATALLALFSPELFFPGVN